MPIVNGLKIALRGERSHRHEGSMYEGVDRDTIDNKTRRHRFVSARSGSLVAVALEVTQRFRWFGTDTLLVAIACGPAKEHRKNDSGHTQIWAVPDSGLGGSMHDFHSLIMPDADAGYNGRIILEVPAAAKINTFDRIDIEELSARDHCITICVQRGFLSEEMMRRYPTKIRPAGPDHPIKFHPINVHEIVSGGPIHPKWFKPIRDCRADVAHVVFRNIPKPVFDGNPEVPVRRSGRGDPKRVAELFALATPPPKRRRAPEPRKAAEIVGKDCRKRAKRYTVCDEDEDDEEPVKTEPRQEPSVREQPVEGQSVEEPAIKQSLEKPAPEQPTEKPAEDQSMEQILSADDTAAEVETRTASIPSQIRGSSAIDNDGDNRSKAKKAAQLALSQRKLDLEKREIEMEKRQLALDQERMEMEYDD